MTDPSADFAAKAKAAGRRARALVELDLMPKRGLQAFYDFTDLVGSATLLDRYLTNHATVAGLAFDGTKGTLTSSTTNGITLPFLYTGSFAIFFLAKITTSGRWLQSLLTGPNRGAFGLFNLAAGGGLGNFQLTAYDDQAAPTRLAFTTGAWLPIRTTTGSIAHRSISVLPKLVKGQLRARLFAFETTRASMRRSTRCQRLFSPRPAPPSKSAAAWGRSVSVARLRRWRSTIWFRRDARKTKPSEAWKNSA